MLITSSRRRRISRRLDRLNAHVAATPEAMKAGAALHLCLDRGTACWWLSTGRCVDAAVARIVVRNAAVVGVGDPLFGDVASQTYRSIDET
jgi:hypothetical protein